MESERPAVRLASVQQLGALGATAASATPVLLASLKESEGSSLEYQRAAIEAVGKVGEGAVEALPYLRDVLAQASDNDLRVAALTSLGAMGASARQALPAIEGLMEDEDEALRQASLSAYGRIESNAEKLVPVYLSALKDRSFTVRQPVIEGLGRLGERAEAAAPSLVELLDSEKDRTVALEALREIRPRSLELCLRMLAHESPGVRLFACDRLGRLRDREAIPALRQALRDDYSFVRRRAREALERIESPREQR
jgi:HEAT repeat protein